MDDNDQIQTLVIPEGFHIERHGNELRVVPNGDSLTNEIAGYSAIMGCLSVLAAFVGMLATTPPLAVGLPVAFATALFLISMAFSWASNQWPAA